MNWRLLAIAAMLPLVGCDGHTKTSDMADCEMKSRQVYPHQTDETARGEAGDYAYLCMKAKGYVRLQNMDRCPIGRGWLGEIDEGCYRKPWPWEGG
jgi:hypothetical protein